MKLSCLPVSLFQDIAAGKMSIFDWADLAKDAGLDALDLSILSIQNNTTNYLENINTELQNRQMDIAMITTYPNFTHPNPLQRERELDYCFHDIALASQLGAAYLRITAGPQYPDMDIGKMAEQVAHYFLLCENKADQYGIKLVYENHGRPGAWKNYDFTYDPKAFLALTRKLKGSKVRVNFDTANTAAFGINPVPIFEVVFSQVETIHVADTVAYGIFQHVAIGTGAAPIIEILDIAKKKGFDGWLCIEEGSGLGAAGIRQAVQTVRNMWSRSFSA